MMRAARCVAWLWRWLCGWCGLDMVVRGPCCAQQKILLEYKFNRPLFPSLHGVLLQGKPPSNISVYLEQQASFYATNSAMSGASGGSTHAPTRCLYVSQC